MQAKRVVRISPFLLARIGEAAAALQQGSLIVQFAGKFQRYNDEAEWNVTHAILSNSLSVSSSGSRTKRNTQVDEVMSTHKLVHVGWMREASSKCPLSSLDSDTQRVYEEHLPDSFAAMLNMTASDSGPMVYFYCLANPNASARDNTYSAFVAAHHIVLDTSVPFDLIQVALNSSTHTAMESDSNCTSHGSKQSNDTSSRTSLGQDDDEGMYLGVS